MQFANGKNAKRMCSLPVCWRDFLLRCGDILSDRRRSLSVVRAVYESARTGMPVEL